MEDHQPAVAEGVLCKWGGAGLVVRGWARRATITKKGYKQVMKKISNEIKRM